MKFTRKELGKVHIEMRFEKSKDSDGPGGSLGSSFHPRGGGDIFFDDEENWSLDSYKSFYSLFSGEKNLLLVATHELGHALGLGHSSKTTAVMAPGGLFHLVGEVKLDIDDIQAIQVLYGAPGLPRPQVEDMKDVDIETGNRR